MSENDAQSVLIDKSCVLHELAGTDEFDRAMFDFASSTLALDKCTAYFYPPQGLPECIAASGINTYYEKAATSLARKYISGAYRHDPNIQCLRPSPVSSFRLNLVRPANLPPSEFRHDFYDRPSIGEELGLIFENQRGRLYLSFFRATKRQSLSAASIGKVRDLAPTLMTALTLHLKLSNAPSADQSGVHGVKSTAIKDIIQDNCDKITNREVEICDHIVRGFSTVAMSLNFGISENTVRTHRKRAYSKLGISSQAELFAIIYDRLSNRS